MDLSCKLLIIGAGPGGYVCAIRAGQLGIDTIIVDENAAGGTCLNIGCIPSKALIHAANEFDKITKAPDGPLGIQTSKPEIDLAQTVAWKDGIVNRLTSGVEGLMKKAKVQFVKGSAKFIDGKQVAIENNDDIRSIKAENIVIATGSSSVELPDMPFGGDILSSTEALSLTSVPKSLAVVGGGYIGLELGTAFAKLGADVTIIEASNSILPLFDKNLKKPVEDRVRSLGIKIKTNTKAEGYSNGILKTNAENINAEKVLVTVGRRPRTEKIQIDELALTRNGAFIDIDDVCQTSMRGVFAIGDITGEPMLAHRAMAQGELVAEYIAGHKVSWDKRSIPAVCFTDPEIISCGELPGESDDTQSSEFPFMANGRAMTTEDESGFIRVVWRQTDHVITGIHAVGEGVSELSAAFSLALEMGARLEDISATIHAHPTRSEGFQEVCMRALGKAVHI